MKAFIARDGSFSDELAIVLGESGVFVVTVEQWERQFPGSLATPVIEVTERQMQAFREVRLWDGVAPGNFPGTRWIPERAQDLPPEPLAPGVVPTGRRGA